MGAASCGKTEKKVDNDSALDTAVTNLVTNTMAADSKSSEKSTEEPVNISEALTLEVVKKNLKHVPESSYYSGYLTVKVTNNAKSEVKGSDYEITYDEIVEDWVGTPEDGGLEDVTTKRSEAGKDIAPGESVEFKLKSNSECQDLKNPKVKALK